MLDSNNKSDKFNEVAQQFEIYGNSLKHEFLVVFLAALISLLLVSDFRMFVEIILSLKNCCQLTRHGRGLCFRNKITAEGAMVHIDSVQETSKSGMMWKKNVTENLIFDLWSSLSLLD